MKEKSYALIDVDKDGKISSQDIENSRKIQELEEKEDKLRNQTRMAWVSLYGILILTVILFLPVIDIQRVQVISEFISMLYVALAGIVSTYMGVSAWIQKK